MLPPYIVLNLRCFDVPLMLFVSGLVYAGREADYSCRFFIHRAMRLLIPVYIFLTGYFVLAFALKYLFSIDFGITVKHVVGSYLLMDGIGYVWIIRVFLMVSILTPFLISLNKSIKKEWIFCLLIVLLTLIQEIMIRFGVGMNVVLVRDFIYYCIGYSLLFLLGLRVAKKDIKSVGGYAILFIGLFVIYAVYLCLTGGGIISMNNYKYPPRGYFLIYGALASLICYLAVSRVCCLHKSKIISFIGMNTIWIYLYHIPLVQLTGRLVLPWYIQYVIVYVIAVIICFAQVSVVNVLQHKYPKLSFLKYFKG